MRQPPRSTKAAAPTCDCDTDPIACLKQMFVDMVQLGRIKRGQSPARRPVFLRLHGVAHGRFEVVPDLPEDLRVGIFGNGQIRRVPALRDEERFLVSALDVESIGKERRQAR